MGSMSALRKIYSDSLPPSIQCTKAEMSYREGGAFQVFTVTLIEDGKETTREITVPASADLITALTDAAKGLAK